MEMGLKIRPSLIWTRLIRSQVTWHIKSTVNEALAELKAQKCLLSVVTKIYIVSSVIRSPKFIMQKKSHHGMCNSSLDSRLHPFGLAFRWVTCITNKICSTCLSSKMQDMSPTNQSIRTLSNYVFMCVMIIIHLASARSVVLVFGHTMYFPVVKGELWNLLVIDSKLRDGQPRYFYHPKNSCWSLLVLYNYGDIQSNLSCYTQPILRDAFEKNPGMSLDQARQVIVNCLRVLFYRDARSLNKVCTVIIPLHLSCH